MKKVCLFLEAGANDIDLLSKKKIGISIFLLDKRFSFADDFFHGLVKIINNQHMVACNFVFITCEIKKMVFFMLHLVGFNAWQLKLLRGIWEEVKVPTPRKYFSSLS